MTEHDSARARMVERQLRWRGIVDRRVLAAMGAVPRELFVPPSRRHNAYADSALPIGEGQTISQPYMVARAVELLRLRGAERVLEVGAGSGYQAAVIAQIAAQVFTLECVASLAAQARRNLSAAEVGNVTVVQADGTLGYPAQAPYDGIVVAAAAPHVPRALLSQLADQGRIVIPVGSRALQQLTVVERHGDVIHEIREDGCVFVPLLGADGWDA